MGYRVVFRPTVYRIVSLSRRAGKTKLITLLASELLKQGISVAVVKHSMKGVDLRGKDTDRYTSAGVKRIVFVSPSELVLFLKYESTSLDRALSILGYSSPIVLVEGFKSESLGKIIGIVTSVDDVNYYLKCGESILALVCTSSDLTSKLKSKFPRVYTGFSKSTIRNLVELVVGDTVEYVCSQLPGLNCGYCGYSTCREYARAYVFQSVRKLCPHIVDVVLRVNGESIPLGPYPKSVIVNVLRALVNTLKGVPENYRSIELRVVLGRE